MERLSRWLQGKQRAMTIKELVRALENAARGWETALDESDAAPTDFTRELYQARADRYHMAAAWLRYREECIKAGVAGDCFYIPEESNDNEA